MIWGGALRTFDYGSEEAVQQSNKDGNGGGSEEVVQQSKKGGKGGDGSVSEPKRSAKKGGKRDASVAKTPTIKLECTGSIRWKPIVLITKIYKTTSFHSFVFNQTKR